MTTPIPAPKDDGVNARFRVEYVPGRTWRGELIEYVVFDSWHDDRFVVAYGNQRNADMYAAALNERTDYNCCTKHNPPITPSAPKPKDDGVNAMERTCDYCPDRLRNHDPVSGACDVCDCGRLFGSAEKTRERMATFRPHPITPSAPEQRAVKSKSPACDGDCDVCEEIGRHEYLIAELRRKYDHPPAEQRESARAKAHAALDVLIDAAERGEWVDWSQLHNVVTEEFIR